MCTVATGSGLRGIVPVTTSVDVGGDAVARGCDFDAAVGTWDDYANEVHYLGTSSL